MTIQSSRALVIAAAMAAITHASATATAPPVGAARTSAADAIKIASLLEEMRTAPLDALPALPLSKYTLPPAGVDVMRVRIAETYEVAGVGRDTVELTGWIAAKHDNARPSAGSKEVRWGSAIVDTEFVGLELTGTSALFGPVRVSLNKDFPSIGQVGDLSIPFPIQIGLERSYSAVRATDAQPPKQPTTTTATAAQPRLTNQNERQVFAVIQKLWDAIQRRDARGMSAFYAKTGDNQFFATPTSRITNKVEDLSAEVQKQFEGVRSIEVVPDLSKFSVKVFGQFAVVTATGRNNVTITDGRSASNEWRSTVRLQKFGNEWLITHDHTSFDPRGAGANIGGAGIAAIGGHCLAQIRVNVTMPTLALHMQTDAPVLWYSEVDTIPPVGYTASVSLTPTALSSGGRQVATLTHGTVKFREIVKQVPLEGTRWAVDPPATR